MNQINGTPLLSLINLAQKIVSKLVPLLIGVALIAFFWYLVVFITKGDESADKRQEGVKGMGYSVLALFVMVSVWGIVALMSSVLGVSVGGSMPPIELPRTR